MIFGLQRSEKKKRFTFFCWQNYTPLIHPVTSRTLFLYFCLPNDRMNGINININISSRMYFHESVTIMIII